MGVKLGEKKLASGKTSLFIDYNYKGSRKKEYIGIVLDNPTTLEIRAKNKEKRRLAESIRAKRELETRFIHSVGLSSYPLNVAVQSCPCV